MAKTYFTGTSTGTKYEVGKQYKTGDDRVMEAMPDGSFKKVGNFVGYTDQGKPVVDDSGRGSVSRGSAGNTEVEWYSDAPTRGGADRVSLPQGSVSGAGNSGKGGGALAPQQQAQQAQPPRVSGGLVQIANPWSSGGAYRTNRVAAAGQGIGIFGPGRIAPWRGLDDPEQHFMVGGWHMKASPRSSNAAMVEERWGDAEFLSPGWFANWAIAGDDYIENIAIRAYGPDKTWDRDHRANVQKQWVDDAFSGMLNWADETVSKVRRDNAILAAAKASVQDAYDARDAIMEQEVRDMEARKANGGYFWGTN